MLLYNIVVLLYGLVIKIASVNNLKAKLWVNGRKDWRKKLSEKMNPFADKKKIWVHCASLGEFEQGRPLIEAMREQYPDHCMILSFFSPSGYEIRKNYEKADVICYLPLDTKKNATDFLNITNPNIIVFIKYEFWVNFLNQIKHKGISAYLVSAVFKEHHPFFKWYGGLFVNSLRAFKKLFVQDQRSYDLLLPLGFNNVEILGDTRFDRVLDVKNGFTHIQEIESFKGQLPLLMAGSSWPQDDELVLTAFSEIQKSKVKLLIAPHEIGAKFIADLIQKLKKKGLSYCLFSEGVKADCDVLVLDTMGMLSRVYYYADLVYIGGGFSDGIHNILEPAVYGLPVVFGGKADHSKFNEAIELLDLNCAFKIMEPNELTRIWQDFASETAKKTKLKADLESYFNKNGKVTAKLMKAIDFV
jgi:3-deoxy-D-manno-octulosonic-acid transferase